MDEYKSGNVWRVKVPYFEEDLKRAEARGEARARKDALRPVFGQLYSDLTQEQFCTRLKVTPEEYDDFCREFGVPPRN